MESEVTVLEEATKGLSKGGKIGIAIACGVVIATGAYFGFKHFVANKNNIDSAKEIISDSTEE